MKTEEMIRGPKDILIIRQLFGFTDELLYLRRQMKRYYEDTLQQ